MLLTTGRIGMSVYVVLNFSQYLWCRFFGTSISLINNLTTLLQCLLDLILVFFCSVFVKFGEMFNSKEFVFFL